MSAYLMGECVMGMHLTDVLLIRRLYREHVSRAHLMGVYLIGMHLRVIYFTGMHLVGVYLMGMHLMDMHLKGVQSWRHTSAKSITDF